MRTPPGGAENPVKFRRFYATEEVPNIGPIWIKNGRTNPSHNHSKSALFFDCFFDAFSDPTTDPKWFPGPYQINPKPHLAWKTCFSEKEHTLIFEGRGSPKHSKNPEKNAPGTDQKSDQNFDRILNWCFTNFGWMLAPKMRPESLQKWSKKHTENSTEKSSNSEPKMVSKMDECLGLNRVFFGVFFGIGFFNVPRAPQGAKINDLGSQNAPPKLPKSAPGRRHPGVLALAACVWSFLFVSVLLWGALLQVSCFRERHRDLNRGKLCPPKIT